MANAGAIRAGRAFVELFADDSKLARGLRQAQAKLSAFGSAVRGIGYKLTAAGAAIVAPLVAAARGVAVSHAALYDMARRTGMSVEALSALEFAAEMTGTSVEGLERAIRLMQKTITGAKDDAEGTAGSLAHLGIAAETIRGLPVAEQFARVAEAISRIADPTERAAAAIKVFGRGGTAMIPLLEDYQRLTGAARKMGLFETAGEVVAAKAAANSMTLMMEAAKKLSHVVGEALLPDLKWLTDWTSRILLGLRDWIGRNGELVRSVLRAGVVIGAAGAALVGLGLVISLVAKPLVILAAVFPLIGSALGLVVSLIRFAITPVVLLGAAVASLGVYFLVAGDAMGNAAKWLGGRFEDLKATAVTAFGGIADALAAGDIPAAAEVLWKALEVVWATGADALHEIWTRMCHGLRDALTRAVSGLTIIWWRLAGGAATVWAWMGKAFKNMLANLVETNAIAGENIYGALEEYGFWLRKLMGEPAAGVEAERTAAYRDRAAAKLKAQQEYSDKVAANEKEFGTEVQKIQDQTDKEVAKVVARQTAAEAQWDAVQKRHLKGSKDALDAKKKELEVLVEQLNYDRALAAVLAEQGEAGGPGALLSPEELAKRLKQQLPGMEAGLQGAAGIAARGTFNPEALLSLKMGATADPIKQVAAATAATRDSARRIADNTNRLVVLAESANVFT